MMIITKTPFRMSFFGGGTDIPAFFNEYGGAVLSTTFDKYCYAVVRRLPAFFDYSSEIVYSKIERVRCVDEIEHPAVRNAMKMMNVDGIRLAYEADLPARTGLGTSSSFAVGMLNAFHCLGGEFASKERLSKEAIYLERTLCAEAGGWQDQIAAAYGGLNKIVFKDNSFEIRPVPVAQERKLELENNLMLFFTGFTRFSSDIQKATKPQDQTARLSEMLSLVDSAEEILIDPQRDMADFGRLLHTNWLLKRGIGSSVSTDAIDGLYASALNAGALGGKLLGAGGGGFLLLFVEPDAQESVRVALDQLLFVPFSFEDKGSHVAYCSREIRQTFKEDE